MFWNTTFRSRDGRYRSAREQEEVDHSIVLSMFEDMKKPIGRLSSRGGWFEDYFLAGKRWGLGNMPTYLHPPPSYPCYTPGPYYSPGPQYSTETKICGGCKHSIDYGNYLGCMGSFFHPACFRCRACGDQINEQEYSMSGKDAYHKSCFRQLTYPKCEVCHQYIPRNAAGLVEYRCHPFWSQKYCPEHESDNTARCCSCERLKPWNAEYVALGDGRSLCLECLETAIMDTGDCQPLYHSIRDFYEGMNMKIYQQVPMLLVERQALNEAIVGEKHGLHQMAETRGLCLSEEQTVPSIKSRPIIDSQRRVRMMRTEPLELIRKCEVTAVLVLFGLPRLLTGSILAHELMHAWLRLTGFGNLSPKVEEGICQVMAYMWLESEVMPGLKSMPSTSTGASSSSKKCQRPEAEKRLGEFFMKQIASDTSQAYGDGFKAGNAAVSKYGLRFTLDHIRQTGTFPF